MLLKTSAILVVVVGIVLGLSLSLSGELIAARQVPDSDDLTLEQARLLAEVMQRVKHDYVEPIDDNVLLDNAIRGMVSDLEVVGLNVPDLNAGPSSGVKVDCV